MDEKIVEYLVGGKRFNEFGSYKFDKLIFGVYILLILAIFVVIFSFYGSDKSDHIYYFCNADGRDGNVCEQPFYLKYPVCERAWATACSDRFVPAGFKFGDPAPLIVRSWGLILGVLLFGAFMINHFMHNRDFKFKRIDLQ